MIQVALQASLKPPPFKSIHRGAEIANEKYPDTFVASVTGYQIPIFGSTALQMKFIGKIGPTKFFPL